MSIFPPGNMSKEDIATTIEINNLINKGFVNVNQEQHEKAREVLQPKKGVIWNPSTLPDDAVNWPT